MGFKEGGLRLSAILSCCVVLTTTAYGEDEPYDKAAIQYLAASEFIGCTNIEGTLYAVDRAKILNLSAGGEISAGARAKDYAIRRLLGYTFRDIKWPEHLSRHVIEGLQDSYFRIHEYGLDLPGLQVVERHLTDEGFVRAVVRLPSPDKKIPCARLDEVRNELALAVKNAPEKLDMAAYFEFCAVDQIREVLPLLGDRMLKYGENVQSVFVGQVLESASAFENNHQLYHPDSAPQDLEAALKRLADNPYMPEACLAAGNVLASSGYSRAARLIYSRGSIIFVGDTAARECKDRAGQGVWPLSFEWPKPAVPPYLILQISQADISKTGQLTPVCRLIIRSAGHLPVSPVEENNEAYKEAWRLFSVSPPNLPMALQLAMASLEKGISADGANLVGRIYMLQGQYALAVPFLEQARFLDHKHPYAQINLEKALRALGENAAAQTLEAENDR
jgi:tetratricopeptide (TPR) repeat protein